MCCLCDVNGCHGKWPLTVSADFNMLDGFVFMTLHAKKEGPAKCDKVRHRKEAHGFI